MSKNKVRHGLSNVHVAFIEEFDEDNKPVYGKIIPWPGAVSLTTDPEGDEYAFYADNIKYFSTYNNDGYTGELESALVPTEILLEMYGWKKDKNGVVVEVANGKEKAFALMAQFEGDKEGGRVVYYNCKANRPNDEYTTDEEGMEVQTQSVELTIQPVKLNDDFISKSLMSKSDNEEVYNGFFDEVYLPDFEEESTGDMF